MRITPCSPASSPSCHDIPMKYRMRALLYAIAFVARARARGRRLRLQKVGLPSQQQVVRAARSNRAPAATRCAYSTAHAAPGFDTDDYVTGTPMRVMVRSPMHSRPTSAHRSRIVVTTRSAGSGGYVGRAGLCDDTARWLVASVDGARAGHGHRSRLRAGEPQRADWRTARTHRAMGSRARVLRAARRESGDPPRTAGDRSSAPRRRCRARAAAIRT